MFNLQNNKSSNIERYFHRKHLDFSEKYPDGDNRRKLVENLLNKTQNQQRSLLPCTRSYSSTTETSFCYHLK